MNYFSHQSAAQRYAEGRPYLHPIIIQRIRATTGLKTFESVLDVGCGTGQSTRAISEFAERVVGIDVSAEMLSQAAQAERIEYVQAPAEDIPFGDCSFSLITVGLAFHWFDQDRFLREARRVLKDSGRLVIYNNGFLGDLTEEPEFRNWNREQYLIRYPTPHRTNRPIENDWVRQFGFVLEDRESFETGISISHLQFVNYLLTQSNVIAAVEQGIEELDDVANWIHTETYNFFEDRQRTALFRIRLDYLRAIQT